MIFSYLLNMQSHPSWVCGLKQVAQLITDRREKSHPSWVCGLKLRECHQLFVLYRHTLRGCVDWNALPLNGLFKMPVTPFVGVWIETSVRKISSMRALVTPFVGVWIETLCMVYHILSNFSHTLRGCVDWNRLIHTTKRTYQMSHPSWVCGLKHTLHNEC